jgi:hypothetical protein
VSREPMPQQVILGAQTMNGLPLQHTSSLADEIDNAPAAIALLDMGEG